MTEMVSVEIVNEIVLMVWGLAGVILGLWAALIGSRDDAVVWVLVVAIWVLVGIPMGGWTEGWIWLGM